MKGQGQQPASKDNKAQVAASGTQGSNAIIRKIEQAKNKELVVDDYKKQLKRMEEEYKMWIADHSKDLLSISSGVSSIEKGLVKAGDLYSKAEGLLESLQAHQLNSGTGGSRPSSPDKKQTPFSHLLKFSLGDLLSENPLLMSEIRASGTPNSQKLSLVKKFSERDSTLSATSSAADPNNPHGAGNNSTLALVEQLEHPKTHKWIAKMEYKPERQTEEHRQTQTPLEVGLMDGGWEGVAATLAELQRTEDQRPGDFGGFEVFGRWIRARDALVERAVEAVEFEGRDEVLAKVEVLTEAGLGFVFGVCVWGLCLGFVFGVCVWGLCLGFVFGVCVFG